jgi:hypothetical protein
MEYFLGLTPTGIVVYKNKSKVGNYFWWENVILIPKSTKSTGHAIEASFKIAIYWSKSADFYMNIVISFEVEYFLWII